MMKAAKRRQQVHSKNGSLHKMMQALSVRNRRQRETEMTRLRASMGSVDLSLPEDPGLLEAAGRVALAHGQLELMLRMTIKTLAGLTVEEVLDATPRSKNWELRRDIVSLFNKKTKDTSLRLRLRAIMGKCESLSSERNRLLHNTWALAPDGSVVTKGPNHAWGQAATPKDLCKLAAQTSDVVATLNRERLEGFIRQVCDASQDAGGAAHT
jgi:hypothetical protein